MLWVRRIFEMIADGHSIYEVAQYLRKTGAPPPGGVSGKWHRATIRNIILSDTYLGTFWWGKEKGTTTKVSVVENGVRTYRKKVKREERPRKEWTAIPVPDYGIPPETIARARETIEGNTRTPSRNSNRTWELSGGIGVCWHCGSRLKPTSPPMQGRHGTSTTFAPREGPTGTTAPAPTQSTTGQRPFSCWSGTSSWTLQEQGWEDFVDKTYNRRMEDLRKMHRFDPSKTRERLPRRIDSLETKTTRLVDLLTDGDISKETYREKKSSRNRSQGARRVVQDR
jgi:Recombinase